MRGYFIDVDKQHFKKTVDFFRKYKKTLKNRFLQEEVYVVAYELYVI